MVKFIIIVESIFRLLMSVSYVPNSKKVALAIGHWQLGIEHLGIRNTMECFA